MNVRFGLERIDNGNFMKKSSGLPEQKERSVPYAENV